MTLDLNIWLAQAEGSSLFELVETATVNSQPFS